MKLDKISKEESQKYVENLWKNYFQNATDEQMERTIDWLNK